MTRRKFPKRITVNLKGKRNLNKFFFGRKNFFAILCKIMYSAFQSKDILDMANTIVLNLPMTTHYNRFETNGHLSIIEFETEHLNGTVEVKHWGNWESGQIEYVKILIEKVKIPKVVFS